MTRPEPVEIRRAAAADLDAIEAIEASWPTTPKWTRGHFESELASERSYLCVWDEGGAVAAYAGLCLVPPEAQVTTVAVRRDRAGQGLGRRLMEHLHAEARRAGCATATLEVSAANEAGLRLYAGLGYRIVGRRPRYYRDGSDAVLMDMRLTEP